MNHHRSPTHSYPHNFPIHASLALRQPTTTLLSPLRSGPLDDDYNDFQSNAWVNAFLSRPPLTGLGITYLRDEFTRFHDPSLVPEDAGLQMQVDADERRRLSLPVGAHETDVSLGDFTSPYRGHELDENRRMIHHAQNSIYYYGDIVDRPELGFGSDIDPAAGDIIGLIPDVNMYDNLRRSDFPHPGINPLDTIRNTSPHEIGLSYGKPASHPPNRCYVDDMPSTTDYTADQSPSPRVIQDIMSILIKPTSDVSCPQWSSVQSSLPSHTPPSVGPEKPITDGQQHVLPTPYNLEYAHTINPSPILNAHLGIELNELISRAERFRSKYPEREIDRAWLSHFAGKLSDRGELLSDFRCYVIGCDQRNKRRDHILVHVGAHIGQRPFACSICPLRFLRKNECKRHEASHSGFRPYSCDICGQSFVRQDLVKRHVKRTHGVRDENEPQGYAKPPRKRARLH